MAEVCRQTNHAYAGEGGPCRTCGRAEPPRGPFVWEVEDVAHDRSDSGTATCEKGAKCAASRALGRLNPRSAETGCRGPLLPGVFVIIRAPHGARWRGEPNCIGFPNWVPEAAHV